jgi:signal transduction histidine kinase
MSLEHASDFSHVKAKEERFMAAKDASMLESNLDAEDQDPLKSQRFLTKISAAVTCITALVFLPVFAFYSEPWLMYFYIPLLLGASLPLVPKIQERQNVSRMILFLTTNGLGMVTAIHFGQDSQINIAALVALCHTLLVTRPREYALMAFGLALTTCTLLIYHIVPDGLVIPLGRYPKYAPLLGDIVEFAAVMIVGIQIVFLRKRLSETTQKVRESSVALQEQVILLSEAFKSVNSTKEANATLVKILCHDLTTPISVIELCLNRPNLTDREIEIISRHIRKIKETISDARDLERQHSTDP